VAELCKPDAVQSAARSCAVMAKPGPPQAAALPDVLRVAVSRAQTML
jgi:hypothetical protein